jgi:hypothetical protein
MKTKMFVVISIYGDQIAKLYADKWAATRKVNALVKSGKEAQNELMVCEVQLGSSWMRVLKAMPPYKKSATKLNSR